MPGHHAEATHRAAPHAEPHHTPVPCLRLFGENALVNRGSALAPEYEEMPIPVLSLSFDYGGTRVAAGDPGSTVFRRNADDRGTIDRDRAAERQARVLLESFGVVELECIEEYQLDPDSEADYLIDVDGDPDVLCSFDAHVLPQLRSLGWQVELDPSCPYRVVTRGTSWYAQVQDGEEPGWFNLEMGIEVDGKNINLLPALLDLLSGVWDTGGFDRLLPGRKRFFALQLEDGSYFPVPRQRMKTVLEVVRDLYAGAGGSADKLWLHEDQIGCLAELTEGLPEGAMRSRTTRNAVARGRSLVESVAPVTVPSLVRATLRPYQREGVAWLQHLRRHGAGGILADDMGLGKTLQVIAHIVIEKLSGTMDCPVLVVAPTSLVGNWQREIEKFAPHLSTAVLHGPRRHRRWKQARAADVVITTYPLLTRDEDRYAEQRFHALVLDEAQIIKNPRSQAHKAVKRIDARQHIALSGTPVENNLDELWAMFDIVRPGLLGDSQRFQNLYRLPIERQGSNEHLDALRNRVQPFIVRRTKEQVASDLPPKTEIYLPIELEGSQRDLYESIRLAGHAHVRKVVRKKGVAASTIDILDALTKLRQVCCDPALVAVEAARKIAESAKLSALLELLDRQLSQGRRILVFSQFTSMLELIARQIRKRGIDHVMLTGQTRNRQACVDAFQRGRASVFLISLKAGGTGLNLTAADTVVHYDPWWNPAAQAQATDRAYRIGQTKPVLVYNMIVAGSVEERMVHLQQRKKQLADAVLSSGGGGLSSLSEQEISNLFAPLE